MHVKVVYTPVLGSLAIDPSPLHFVDMYPGRVYQQPIFLTNLFPEPLHLYYLGTSDQRVIPVLTVTTLEPFSRAEIGYVMVNPKRCAPEDDYMLAQQMNVLQQFDIHTNVTATGEITARLVPIPDAELEQDQGPPKSQAQRLAATQSVWNRLERDGLTEVSATVVLSSNIQTAFSFPVTFTLINPSLLANDTVDFQLIMVSNICLSLLILSFSSSSFHR